VCWCDAACQSNGDCCANVVAVCGGAVDPATSCSTAECGDIGGDCWCDASCVDNFDCCADACAVCGAC